MRGEPSGRRAERLALALLAIAIAALSATSATAQAPGRRIPRVVFVNAPATGEASDGYQAFRRGMRELGWAEGQTVVLEYRGPGRDDSFREVAAAVVRSAPDVIVAGGGGAGRALADATATIPIVMTVAANPVGAGFAASLARPGKNITGQTVLSAELSGKRIEIIKETLPRVSRVTALWHEAAGRNLQETEAAARALGVTLDRVEVKDAKDLPAAVDRAAKDRAGALVAIQSAFFAGPAVSRQLAQLALQRRLPAFSFNQSFAAHGGLVYFGTDVPEGFRRAAGQVDKILKGARAGDLPFEQPTTFDLVINLRTARALGVEIPTAMRVRATRLIE